MAIFDKNKELDQVLFDWLMIKKILIEPNLGSLFHNNQNVKNMFKLLISVVNDNQKGILMQKS
jgi:hypothetical protein